MPGNEKPFRLRVRLLSLPVLLLLTFIVGAASLLAAVRLNNEWKGPTDQILSACK